MFEDRGEYTTLQKIEEEPTVSVHEYPQSDPSSKRDHLVEKSIEKQLESQRNDHESEPVISLNTSRDKIEQEDEFEKPDYGYEASASERYIPSIENTAKKSVHISSSTLEKYGVDLSLEFGQKPEIHQSSHSFSQKNSDLKYSPMLEESDKEGFQKESE